jgi:Fe-S-cluster containining protein
MQFVPWRYIAGWKCLTCGDCCKLYSVVLNFQEWLRIVKGFGVEQTASGIDRLYVRRKEDGSCAFLSVNPSGYGCGIQYMKPKACQLWPFKVLAAPEFGYASEAIYPYGGRHLFVYADSMCHGLRYGNPAWEFANQTLREFVEIAVGVRRSQLKTTANLGSFGPWAYSRI